MEGSGGEDRVERLLEGRGGGEDEGLDVALKEVAGEGGVGFGGFGELHNRRKMIS